MPHVFDREYRVEHLALFAVTFPYNSRNVKELVRSNFRYMHKP